MKILVVEDDHAVSQALKHLLSSCHYAVDIAADGEVGLQMADDFSYDLILLDILLPIVDGVTVCQQLRKRELHTPILLLTGQDGGHNKATALNAGADDYVVKPFDAEELIARVQALLRRGGAKTQPTLTWGSLAISPSSCQVTYGTHLLPTTPKEYAILELFLRNPQKVFSARAILDQAWSSLDSPGEESVRGHIKELRKKLKEAGAPGEFIKTVYRMGYKLNPAYAETSAPPEDTIPTAAHIAELRAANEELRATVTALQSSQLDLQQRNQTLADTNRILTRSVGDLKTPSDPAPSSRRSPLPIAPRFEPDANGVAEHLSSPLESIIRNPLVVSAKAGLMEVLALLKDSPPQALLSAQNLAQSGDAAASQGRGQSLPKPYCVVVLDKQRVVGVLTPNYLVHLLAQQQPLEWVSVQDVMTQPVAMLKESSFVDVGMAIALLNQHGVECLPVVDENEHLTGIVTYQSLWQ